MFLLPPHRRVAQRLTEDPTGQIGLGVQHAEARLLHDPFETLGLRARIPTVPRFPGPEAFGGRTPQDHRHPVTLEMQPLP